jgi:Ca2+-binding EF-hand superfamily protein
MQLAECLSSLGLDVTAAELQVLARKFDDKGDGWVNYVAFQVRGGIQVQKGRA